MDFRHMDSSTRAIDDPSINPHMLLICWLNPIFFGWVHSKVQTLMATLQ